MHQVVDGFPVIRVEGGMVKVQRHIPAVGDVIITKIQVDCGIEDMTTWKVIEDSR
jgi:hypothetical protein